MACFACDARAITPSDCPPVMKRSANSLSRYILNMTCCEDSGGHLGEQEPFSIQVHILLMEKAYEVISMELSVMARTESSRGHTKVSK